MQVAKRSKILPALIGEWKETFHFHLQALHFSRVLQSSHTGHNEILKSEAFTLSRVPNNKPKHTHCDYLLIVDNST